MANCHGSPTDVLLLGIEGGATRTTCLVATPQDHLVRRHETGPANFRLLSDSELESRLREIHPLCPQPAAIGLGLAGVREPADRQRLRTVAQRVWPQTPVFAGNDLETALAATPTRPSAPPTPRVVIISGTGSCVFGQTPDGHSLKVGGWGHHLGDRGSGYDLGLQAVRESIQHWDRTGHWPPLGTRILQHLLLNEPNDLIPWAQSAAKPEIASVALPVFQAAAAGDRLARQLLARAAHTLADDALTCARRLCPKRRPVEFILAGSVLLKQAGFRRTLARIIRAQWPSARILALPREGAWGAIALARTTLASPPPPSPLPARRSPHTAPPPPLPAPIEWDSPETSPTEQRNPRSLHLDRLPIEAAVDLMLDEEKRVRRALQAQRPALAQGVRLIAQAFRQGGRLFYAGAGTSGRLGVLDASECPPTFRVPPDQVQAIMAGGPSALWRSLEGAEDDQEAGARAVLFRGVRPGDVLVGIAASGRTPFVWGALHQARQLRARTVLLCFNPHLEIPKSLRPNLVIAPNVGPEILTGSTRLKAGTATKLILNLFTTLAMVQNGKTVSNLMVDVHPSNAKLRDRAIRIVRTLTDLPAPAAQHYLETAHWVVKDALRLSGLRVR